MHACMYVCVYVCSHAIAWQSEYSKVYFTKRSYEEIRLVSVSEAGGAECSHLACQYRGADQLRHLLAIRKAATPGRLRAVFMTTWH